jgi:hypothetical protein
MHGKYTTTRAILLGCFIADTIDIGAAALIYLVSPIIVLHSVASGLIGRPAAAGGGLETAALGMVLQWGMSLIIAGVYVIASNVVPLLKRLWLVCGLAYGVGVFFMMNYVVVPLSALHKVPQFTPDGRENGEAQCGGNGENLAGHAALLRNR